MRSWAEAMRSSLYGADGFYRLHEPRDHFRTSAMVGPVFARCVASLAARVDDLLGCPESFDLVDVGAGDGALLRAVVPQLPQSLAERVRPLAVELRTRPHDLAPRIAWASTPPPSIAGLLMAHELLDNVPCDVVEHRIGRPQAVVVDTAGNESYTDVIDEHDRAWLDRWWPLRVDGDRAEIGRTRDAAWVDLVTRLERGLALAVDFGHVRGERVARRFVAGTLTGYRSGRPVPPVPDGTCDITAHVAMDACAAAGLTAGGAEHSALLRQHTVLTELGLTASRPSLTLARTDPVRYLDQLMDASSAAELLDRASLGSFWWLIQSKGIESPIGGD